MSPVLSMDEAPKHPHNVARRNFIKVKDHLEPTPSPRLTDLQGDVHPILKKRMEDNPPCPTPGEHTLEILKELGYSQPEIERLSEDGAIVLEEITKSKL